MVNKNYFGINWASLIAQLERIHLQCKKPGFNSWVGKICRRRERERLPNSMFVGFPCGSAGKESVCNAGDLHSILGLGRFPWRRERVLPEYSGLENSRDCIVLELTKNRTWLSSLHFHFRFNLKAELEEAKLFILAIYWECIPICKKKLIRSTNSRAEGREIIH